jgi:hypothetical protein
METPPPLMTISDSSMHKNWQLYGPTLQAAAAAVGMPDVKTFLCHVPVKLRSKFLIIRMRTGRIWLLLCCHKPSC